MRYFFSVFVAIVDLFNISVIHKCLVLLSNKVYVNILKSYRFCFAQRVLSSLYCFYPFCRDGARSLVVLHVCNWLDLFVT